MVTLPAVRHVATPLELIVATAALEVAQTKPLLEVRARVVLLVILPVALNATCPCGVLVEPAGFGARVMARSLGLLLPHPDNRPARETIRTRLLSFMFISGALDSPATRVVGWSGMNLNRGNARLHKCFDLALKTRNGYNPSLRFSGRP